MTDTLMLLLAYLLTWGACEVVRTCWRDGYRGEAFWIGLVSVPFPVLAVLIAVQLMEGL